MTCANVFVQLYYYWKQTNDEGQQKEPLPATPTKTCFVRSGKETRLISDAQRRVRVPLFCLTEEEVQQFTETHPSAPLLKAISDYDVKLVQRLFFQ